MSNFPNAFIDQLKTLFSEQESQYILDSLEETAPVSIRCNPYFKGNLAVSHENITQNNRGYFLNERPIFTADPAFHAGLYYPQEANSMWIGAVFSFLRARYFEPDEALLDFRFVRRSWRENNGHFCAYGSRRLVGSQ